MPWKTFLQARFRPAYEAALARKQHATVEEKRAIFGKTTKKIAKQWRKWKMNGYDVEMKDSAADDDESLANIFEDELREYRDSVWHAYNVTSGMLEYVRMFAPADIQQMSQVVREMIARYRSTMQSIRASVPGLTESEDQYVTGRKIIDDLDAASDIEHKLVLKTIRAGQGVILQELLDHRREFDIHFSALKEHYCSGNNADVCQTFEELVAASGDFKETADLIQNHFTFVLNVTFLLQWLDELDSKLAAIVRKHSLRRRR